MKKGDYVQYLGHTVEIRNLHKDDTATIIDFITGKYIARVKLSDLEIKKQIKRKETC